MRVQTEPPARLVLRASRNGLEDGGPGNDGLSRSRPTSDYHPHTPGESRITSADGAWSAAY